MIKKIGFEKIIPFILSAIIAVIFLPVTSTGASAQEIDRLGYTNSAICGYCHADIYENWKKSSHASAYTNPSFMEAYRKAYTESDGAAKDFCLKCHGPAIQLVKKIDDLSSIAKDGVTCDFCHTVDAVDLGNHAAPFKLDIGGKKKASLMQLKKPPYLEIPAPHQPAYSVWFNKSELCAGCHEMPNMNGIAIGSAYSEWKETEYAKDGIQCQDCHMAPRPGYSVAVSQQKPKKSFIPDHSLFHNVEWLSEPVELEIIEAKLTETGRYVVNIAMTNIKGGHNIPTGTASRTLALEVRLKGDGLQEVTQMKTFGKRIVDKDGSWLATDAEAQLKGVKIKYNTALKPQERRVVRFVFEKAPSGKVRVSSRAFLTYNPVADSEENVHTPLGSVE